MGKPAAQDRELPRRSASDHRLLFAAGRFRQGWRELFHLENRDRVMVNLGHGVLEAVELHAVTDLRLPAERLDYRPGDRRAKRALEACSQLLVDLQQRQIAQDQPAIVAGLANAGMRRVVLVPDFADQLLEQILQGNEARRSAEL